MKITDLLHGLTTYLKIGGAITLLVVTVNIIFLFMRLDAGEPILQSFIYFMLGMGICIAYVLFFPDTKKTWNRIALAFLFIGTTLIWICPWSLF